MVVLVQSGGVGEKRRNPFAVDGDSGDGGKRNKTGVFQGLKEIEDSKPPKEKPAGAKAPVAAKGIDYKMAQSRNGFLISFVIFQAAREDKQSSILRSLELAL